MRITAKVARRRLSRDLDPKDEEDGDDDDAASSTQKYLFPILLLVLVSLAGVALFHRYRSSLPTAMMGSVTIKVESKSATNSKHNTKLADDCFHVFVDVGGRLGTNARFVLEPQWYSDALDTHKVFDDAFGPPSVRDNRDICAIAMNQLEGGEDLQRLALESAYSKMGWRYFAVATNTTTAADGIPESVPGVGLAKWIQKEIGGRRIPDTVYGDYSRSSNNTGKLVMKLDVEGMELLIAPSAILREAVCGTMDSVFGEWNFTKSIEPIIHNPVTGQGALSSLSFEHKGAPIKLLAEKHFNKIWNTRKPSGCKAQWMGLVQDEKHLIQEDAPLPHLPLRD